MGAWQFEERSPRYVETELTQRDQFNNDEVTLADAIVREVIQNSTDAPLDDGRVKVRFDLHEISQADAPRFRELFIALAPHLKAYDINLTDVYQKPARVLVIEDFGTRGLTGDPGALDDQNFHNFWRRHGRSVKAGRQGGRWGLGKLVYSSASDIRCFFGLTIREGDVQPLLMGQAVLSNHEIGIRRYVAHGFWFGRRNADEMQMPINDSRETSEFSRLTGITRTTQSGLSIVIPYISSGITHESIIRGVVENYYFPILAGRLVVEVGATVIDKNNFLAIANGVRADARAERFRFVVQVSERMSNNLPPAFVARLPGIEKEVGPSLFDTDAVAAMKQAYGRGDLVHVRVPIQLRRKDGQDAPSWIDLFLKVLPEEAKPFVLFARGSITVPGEARYFSGPNAYGAFVAADPNVVSFLGDAENPAHTTWSGTAEKVTRNWRNAGQSMKYLRYALWGLYTLVSDQGERKDQNALIDFFSLEDLTSSRGAKKERVPKPRPELPPPSSKAFRIQKKGSGGFAIVPGQGALSWSYPKAIRVRVAYDVLGANPFAKHSPYDFDFTKDEIDVELTNMSIEAAKPNMLVLSATSPEFRLEATGFDVNRDIVVDAKART
jgi:hypothetical protein